MRMKIIFLSAIFLISAFHSWSMDFFSKKILYWVSYTTNEASYLLQIDGVGNVVQNPRKLPTPKGVKKIALSQNGNQNLNLWYANNHVVCTVIRKHDLRILKSIQMTITTTNPELLKVTQKDENNFMAVNESTGNDFYYAEFVVKTYPIGLGSVRIPREISMPYHKASADFSCDVCAGSISSDGRTVFWYTQEDTLEEPVRMLISDVHDDLTFSTPALGAFSNVVGNSTSGVISIAAAASNVLPDGRRYIVFLTALQPTLVLQIIEPDFSQISPINLISKKTTGPVSIDPEGHFVIFGHRSVGKSGPFIAFQALDATGHPSGSPRVMVNLVKPIGLDILKDSGI
jgi:hypothetical protein